MGEKAGIAHQKGNRIFTRKTKKNPGNLNGKCKRNNVPQLTTDWGKRGNKDSRGVKK